MRIKNGCVNMRYIKTEYDTHRIRSKQNSTSSNSSHSRVITANTYENNTDNKYKYINHEYDFEHASKTNSLFLGIFYVGKLLGEGTYGKVRYARNIKNNRLSALKIIDKKKLKKKSQLERVLNEIRIMSVIDHPNLCKLYQCYETDSAYILELEYIEGMELFKHVSDKKWLSEEETLPIFYQLLDGINYLHQHKIIHRDIKLENVIFDKKGNIKIIDFGFACTFEYYKFCETHCGSPYYAAPEMVSANEYIGPEVDVWSLGVVLYTLVHGYLPFESDCVKNLYKKILECQYFIDTRTSPTLRNLIIGMICFDTKSRIRLGEIYRHPWVMRKFPLTYRVPVTNINIDIVKKMLDFNFDEQNLLFNLKNVYSTDWAFYKLISEKSMKGININSIGYINDMKTKNKQLSHNTGKVRNKNNRIEQLMYENNTITNEIYNQKFKKNFFNKINNNFNTLATRFFSRFKNLLQPKLNPVAVIEKSFNTIKIQPYDLLIKEFTKRGYKFYHWNDYMMIDTDKSETLFIHINVHKDNSQELKIKIALISGNYKIFLKEFNEILLIYKDQMM